MGGVILGGPFREQGMKDELNAAHRENCAVVEYLRHRWIKVNAWGISETSIAKSAFGNNRYVRYNQILTHCGNFELEDETALR